MRKLRFCLIGDGNIARYHKNAIEHVGGELDDIHIIDPKYIEKYYVRDMGLLYSKGGMSFDNYSTLLTREAICREMVEDNLIKQWSMSEARFDYAVICSNSHLHREQIKTILNIAPKTQIICEKPAFLPWENIIDDNRINIVLQLRYLPGLPEKADLVKAVFVRDEEYFKTWKSDARKTGGLFFNLFIHYVDLAIQLGADFKGMVSKEGRQEKKILSDYKPEKLYTATDVDDPKIKELKSRRESYQTPIGIYRYFEKEDRYYMDLYNQSNVDYGTYGFTVDLLKADMQSAYNLMYEDIVSGGGIKPSHLFYLNWILQRNSELFGFGKNGMNKLIRIGKELL